MWKYQGARKYTTGSSIRLCDKVYDKRSMLECFTVWLVPV